MRSTTLALPERQRSKIASKMFAFVLDTINWLFWCSIWQLEQAFVKIIVAIIPLSFLKSEVMKRFDDVGIKTSFLGDPDIGKFDKKKYFCEIVVRNPDFFRSVAFDDSLGLGESYMVRWFWNWFH